MFIKIRKGNVTDGASDARIAVNDRIRKFWRIAAIVVDSSETVTTERKIKRWEIVAGNLDRSRRTMGRRAEGFAAPTLRSTVSGKCRKWDRREKAALTVARRLDGVRRAQAILRREITELECERKVTPGRKNKDKIRARIHHLECMLAR